nr:hypothetical protein [Candidatus Freyrarchaeum guaymaensis]HDO80729.1 hypothetical protein [Candidatus Bathyarchaeota archaeon]
MKAKTSVYVDRDLWEKFKVLSASRKTDVSSLLKELIREETMEQLDEALSELGLESGELDFEPVKVSKPVSGLVRVMRDERRDGISGLQCDY